MACDGNIADEEMQLIKEYTKQSAIFNGLEVEKILNEYISSINEQGLTFLNSYLRSIKAADLSQKEELQIVKVAIAMIEADKVVQYSEIKFFKKIRCQLKISDDCILSVIPSNTIIGDKEDYIMPDIQESDDIDWFAKFENIRLD